jgi:hypothetical protein
MFYYSLIEYIRSRSVRFIPTNVKRYVFSRFRLVNSFIAKDDLFIPSEIYDCYYK